MSDKCLKIYASTRRVSVEVLRTMDFVVTPEYQSALNLITTSVPKHAGISENLIEISPQGSREMCDFKESATSSCYVLN